LEELAVSFLALLFAQDQALVGAVGNTGLLLHVVKVSGIAVGPQAVRPAGGLDLQDSQVHPHLDDLSAILGLDEAGLDHPRLEFPATQSDINILVHISTQK